MTIYGIDASNHQGNQSSLGGVDASFYVHKLTEGTGYTDPYAAHNLAWAKGQGISLRGGYHFIRAGSGAAQADYFIGRARALFGQNLRGNLWQLDCESDASFADIEAFKHRWDAVTGSAPIFFYTGDWWLQPRGYNVASLGFAGLWSAPNRGYFGKASNIRASDWNAGWGGFSKITIVQYDARSAIGDTNQFQGSLAQLKALCAGTPSEPSSTAPGKGTDVTTRTSVSKSDNQTADWGKFTTLVWPHENTDPDHVHADGSYPGFVSPRSAYVDLDLYLMVDGMAPGDEYQVRMANHSWKGGKSTGAATEYLADAVVTSGAQAIRVSGSLYVAKGHHLYVELMPVRRASATDAPAPRVTSGVWRLRQDG